MKSRLLVLWLHVAALIFSMPALADNKPLKVAISTDNPPLAYQVDGKAVGIEADLLRLLQVQLGQTLQVQLLASAELLPALERGDVDIVMAGFVITPEREQHADFALPYFHSGEMAIIRTDDVMRFRGPVALLQNNIKVGFVAGSAGADYVKSTMVSATASSCATADECLHALLARRIDVFIDSPATSWRIATSNEYAALMSLYRPLTEEYFAWAIAKNNGQLRERLNVALQNMQQLQMFEHILNRWIPVRVSSD
jgi:ABC-type amino acid transport substrate-binding protein